MGVATASLPARPLAVRRSGTMILVGVLILTTAWSVLAGGWTDTRPGVVVVAMLGVIEGLVLARSRAARPLALAAAPVLLPTNAATRPTSATGGPLHALGQYAGAALTGLLGNAQWEFNVGLGTLLWVCGAWAAWFAVRERRGTVATGPCWAVIAVNVINAPSNSMVTLPAALAAASAILLIASVHLDQLSDSWRRRRISVLPGTSGRFAVAAGVGGVLIVLLALLAPPLSSTDVSGRLFGFGSGPGHGAGPGGGPGSGPGGATVRFNAATIPGGALTLANSQVLTYHSSLETGVYLRMATDGVFDGGNWLPDQSANNNGDDTQEIVDAGPIARDRQLSDGGVGVLQQSVSITVTMIDDSSDTDTLPFAGEPDRTGVAARVSGLTGPEVNGPLLTVDTVQALRAVTRKTFVTTATESTATADQLRSAGTRYPSFVVRDFLGLPDDTTGGAATIRALANQWTRGAATPYDKATTIEAMLRNPKLFHYTLTPPAPPNPATMWPVTFFLTTSHSGYCQYYATAMGAMLRAIGIPARLVNGYGPGTVPNAASRRTAPDAAWTVSSNDAHTWVEAYFPGYGWVPFEPTPPSPAGDYQPFQRGAVGVTPPGATPAGGTGAPTPSPTLAAPLTDAGSAATAQRAGNAHAVLIGLGGIAGLLIATIVLFAVWFLRPRDIRGIWTRVGIIGRLVGVGRDRSLTFGEYVHRVSAALPNESSERDRMRAGTSTGTGGWRSRVVDGLRDIAAISDRACYAEGSVRSAETARMKSAWRRVALLAPRLGRRALVRPESSP